MPTLFHVTSPDNRESIERYGLDWTRMGGARGVAGSARPEVDGVFLCRDEFEADFFCGLHADDGPMDVWAVDGVEAADLVQAPEGFVYLPRPVPPDRLTLWRSEHRPAPLPGVDGGGSAYGSSLTITLGDGEVLRDAEAHEWIRRQSPSG